MKCPECGGDVWDNTAENDKREQNGEKLRPDYSCKDKDGCGWLMWREKGKKKILVESLPKEPKKPDPRPDLENKKENTELMCRTNLMVALINKIENPDNLSSEFKKLWKEIES